MKFFNLMTGEEVSMETEYPCVNCDGFKAFYCTIFKTHYIKAFDEYCMGGAFKQIRKRIERGEENEKA